MCSGEGLLSRALWSQGFHGKAFDVTRLSVGVPTMVLHNIIVILLLHTSYIYISSHENPS